MPTMIGPVGGSSRSGSPAVARKILFAVSMVLIAASVLSLIEAKRFLSKSVRTSATVVELRRETQGFRAIFEYRASDGEAFTKASPSKSDPPLYRIGDTVTLAYQPRIPSRARLVGRWHTYLLAIILSALAAILLLVGCCLPRKQRVHPLETGEE